MKKYIEGNENQNEDRKNIFLNTNKLPKIITKISLSNFHKKNYNNLEGYMNNNNKSNTVNKFNLLNKNLGNFGFKGITFNSGISDLRSINKKEKKENEKEENKNNENINQDKIINNSKEKNNNHNHRENKEEKNNEMKEEDEIYTSYVHEEILEKLDKYKLQEIVKKGPKRTKTKLNGLISYLRKSTDEMNEFEKAYIIFYWLHENIEYDIAKKQTKNAAYIPNDIYNSGKCICEGYSKLFQYIGQELGLKIVYINGYSPDEEYNDAYTSHAWNALEVNQMNYLIDATWGSGSSNNGKYKKDLNEFYFCTNPEYFIFTHFPEESKWQLLEKPIENEEFQKRVRFNEIFFKYFKGSTDLYNNIIITKNEYKIRLYKRFPESMVLVTIMVKRDNYYTSENDCKKIIIDKEKYIDIKCIFTEKNNYEVNIKANDGRSKSFINAVTYKIQYLDESEKQFNYGEINYKESRPLEHDEIIASLNKDKIKLIVYKATERKKSSLKLFIEYLKEETKYLNEFEKAYTLFFWIFKNLSYEKSTSNLKEDEYEKIYKEEKLDISYSKMFNYILKNIGLNVFEINGFTKNSSKYIYPNQILGYNTSWNILE